jgi:DNA-directed RNA polymerase subunit M/transcription elongation factor TFIIS
VLGSLFFCGMGTDVCRIRALEAFSQFLDFADALDLENACFDIAYVNNSPYTRPFNRAMYALHRSPDFAEVVNLHGALRAMSYKDSALFKTDSQLAVAVEKEHEVQMYKALLADLSRNDIQLGMEGGVKCAKCHSSDISFSFLQTRSSDEGTTVFSICDRCGKRWKLG